MEGAAVNEEQRLSERVRREAAHDAAGNAVESSGREVPSGQIKQMVSVRLEAELASELRKAARARNASVSDLLREAAALFIEQARQPQVVVPGMGNTLDAPV